MITIREMVDGKANLALEAYGTSEGSSKGWDSRGRGRKSSKQNVGTQKVGKHTVPVSEKGFGKTNCCGAEVAIDQESGVPYCKKCFNEVEMLPKK